MGEHIDKNLRVDNSIGEADVCFYDVKNDPFDIYGLYNYRKEETFKRLPDEVGLNTNKGVANLYTNTAGGRLRFSTDSMYIALKVEMSHLSHMPHMPLVSSAGFDLYLDCPKSGVSRFYDIFKPVIGSKGGFEAKITFNNRKVRYITINFPSYSSVTSLKIGLQSNAILNHGLKYRNMLPIVYYGSSITQGACSSRPGNAYENIISRRTNTDFINLGFSGAAAGEVNLAKYMSSIPMSAFVSDYDHNSPSVEDLKKTHCRLYEIIRKNNPDIPYLIISKPDFNKRLYPENINRRDVIYDTYRHALEQGDTNVYYIDGSSLFRTVNEDMCTVDNCHPNDYGFYLIADKIESELRWIWALTESI